MSRKKDALFKSYILEEMEDNEILQLCPEDVETGNNNVHDMFKQRCTEAKTWSIVKSGAKAVAPLQSVGQEDFRKITRISRKFRPNFYKARHRHHGQMPMSKVRIWILGFLLALYLIGILLLSAVTLYEPRENSIHTKAANDQRHHVSKPKNMEYGGSGIRPPKKFRIDWCTNLQYQNPPKDPVALASFPGSGNTWLRYLLQQATGIYTGSVYKDYGLLKSGFPAESISNGSVLVVKTHEWGREARKPFSKAILLVRSPASAIQAEFNRQSGGHIGFASPDRYKRIRGKYWQQFVADKLQAWKCTNLDWLYNFTGPTHVIFYEQLVDNVEHTLSVLLEFLGVSVSKHSFSCALERQEGIYRRKKKPLEFDPYTSAMKKRLQIVQQRVYEEIYNVAAPSKKKR